MLEQALLRLRKYNLKLNASKSVFGGASVHYLGYNISGTGIHPGDEKLKMIRDFPVPDTPKKIREFVGFTNYFRFLLPAFAAHSARLTDILKFRHFYIEIVKKYYIFFILQRSYGYLLSVHPVCRKIEAVSESLELIKKTVQTFRHSGLSDQKRHLG